MRSALLVAPIAFLATLLSACAGSTPDPGTDRPTAYPAAAVDTAPERLACTGYLDPTMTVERVILEYTVTRDGSVQPGTIRPVLRNNFDREARPSAAHVAEAKEIARACKYEPGRLGGEPVPVRVRHIIAIAR